MRRRDLLTLIAGAATLRPLASGAQQKATPVIGILAVAAPDNAGAQRNLAAFREGLAEAGYVEGRNVAIEYRWASANYDRLPGLAAELVARNVDVIVTEGGDGAALAAKGATSTIPIVCFVALDPVKRGFAASLARPGGNLTGISLHGLIAKRIELLCELVPEAKAIAILVNPNVPFVEDEISAAQQAARTKGVLLHVVTAGTESEIAPAVAAARALHVDGLVVVGNPLFSRLMSETAALPTRHSLPAIYSGRFYVEAGGLLSYASELRTVYHRNGVYAGKILRGARPADLPIEQPTRFHLAINLKTAKALGLTVPQSLFARADEVIE